MPPGEAAEILSVRNVSRGSNAQITIRPFGMVTEGGKKKPATGSHLGISTFIPYMCIPGRVTNASSRKTMGDSGGKTSILLAPLPHTHPEAEVCRVERSLSPRTFVQSVSTHS